MVLRNEYGSADSQMLIRSKVVSIITEKAAGCSSPMAAEVF